MKRVVVLALLGLNLQLASAQAVLINGTGAADSIDVSGSDQPHDLRGRGGTDTLRGSQAGDRIDGGGGYDAIYGNGGDDTLIGGRGNDQIDGGTGRDTAVYSGTFDAYVVSGGSGAATVAAVAASDGTDTLSRVELMSFADGTWDGAVFVPKDPPNADALRAVLDDAPAGSWLRVNRNHFSDVWTPLAQRPSVGAENPARVLFAWSSMTWDSNRDKLVFWGGGHANYSGNEVYRFDAHTLRWERASLPSEIYNPLGDQQWFAIDGPHGAPIAAHTYDNQEFLPLADRFVTFGGGKFNSDAFFVLLDGTTPTGPYFWDPSRADPAAVGGAPGTQVSPASFPQVPGGRMWENRDTLATRGVGSARPYKFVNGATAYAGANGRDVLLVAESPGAGARLFRYTIHDLANPAADQWEVIGIKGDAYSDQGAGAFDPGRQLFVRTAKGAVGQGITFWNLATAGPANKSRTVYPVDPTGQFVLTRRHGMDFDAVRKVFVLWDGDADVWYLTPPENLVSGTWTVTRAPVLLSGELPTQESGRLVAGKINEPHGILGRWKYARRYDVFLGVQDPVRGDIWVYKPANWQPQ